MNTNDARRRNIAEYMTTYARTYGKQPSVREIGQAVGISSTSTTAGYLKRMVKDGILSIRNDVNYYRYSVNTESNYFGG